MHASFIILAVITSLSSSASAIGRVLVFNNCSFDVWPWSLDTIGENGILSRLRPEEQQAFPMNPQPGGSSVSVAVSPGALSSGAARTIFGYQLTETGTLTMPMEPCPWEIPMPVHGTKIQKFWSQWAGLELLWKFHWELGLPNGTVNGANIGLAQIMQKS
ncbi:hypothetical protein PMAA_076860 [Talaromyces marneffei ATCC 18224]|uniref:Uncharacterized protein n=1 Tax=Talaromyces marneffei (strain ATCC 18224 / CBS 334.59 / QM 7333) TaxID=441960 RepID=B6QCU1_TALMQ|nr:hypothetical protein PMAA_076860 [Talaromyces marneffei ATCC 18224]